MISARSHARETALQAEVERLGELCRVQQRMIANLSFRHVLEVLPDPGLTDSDGKPLQTSAARWKQFWNDTWNKAQNQADFFPGSSASHPFSELLTRFDWGTQERIRKTGEDLFDILSTNIHHYPGEFAFKKYEWDVPQAAILRALTPVTARKQDGSVDWNLERQRF